ncbi:MAG: hypothetical protein GQ574_21845 [Crocinitomix sp.]|nr:hypothetical protein [Crocinitomix sp.]
MEFFESVLEFNHFTKAEFTDNYDSQEQLFTDLITFFDSIVPDNAQVTLEFAKNKDLEIFHVIIDSSKSYNWNVELNSKKCDSLCEKLGWRNGELEIINSKLTAIDCISINNGNKYTIGYKRDGMGIYYYNIHPADLTEAEIANCSGCISIFHRKNIVLEYGSGATGSLCFPERFR